MEDAIDNLKKSIKKAVEKAEAQIDAQRAEISGLAKRLQESKQELAMEEDLLEQDRQELFQQQEELRVQQEEVSRLREELEGRSFFACCTRPTTRVDPVADEFLQDAHEDELVHQSGGSEGQDR
mmetsp:Transcript_120373/g.236602  ORF Transcript_120373/g.236602 Transcript_120373/m.236602 type:complete len:124 (-) Transcript_120373:290-661(-)